MLAFVAQASCLLSLQAESLRYRPPSLVRSLPVSGVLREAWDSFRAVLQMLFGDASILEVLRSSSESTRQGAREWAERLARQELGDDPKDWLKWWNEKGRSIYGLKE